MLKDEQFRVEFSASETLRDLKIILGPTQHSVLR